MSYLAPDETNLKYSVNVPAASASSDTGDIFFQISAPTSYQWVALGEGTEMAGANMFVMYTSASGTNVTVSPRLGKGEFEPLFNPAASITLLDGSGVMNGMMIANVRCASCMTWDGGSMQYTSTSAPWIWSAKSGTPLNSDDTAYNIVQHDNMGNFNIDLTKATGGSSEDPFTAPSASSSGAIPSSTGSSASAASGSSSGGDMTMINNETIVHGVVMGLAFLIFFPSGAILINLVSFPGLIWVHAGTQIFAWILSIVGLGLGISIAQSRMQLSDAHPIIGIIVVSLLAFQPIGGYIHHLIWKKQHKKTVVTLGHIWTGRVLIILGIINGGLGLQLAANTTGGEIAYGIVAGVVGVTYLAIILISMVRKRGVPTGETGEKVAHTPGSQSSSERRIDTQPA